jgi:hypothetical protein
MKRKFSWAGWLVAAMMLLALAHPGASRAEDPLKLEAILIWGTDSPQSPNPKHIPVDEALAKKLQKSPYRWKNYFEVNRLQVEIPAGETKKGVTMSKHCSLDVSNLGGGRIEIKLFGDSKYISDHKENLGENCTLIIAGPAENETAWMVVIRKCKPGK